ncbi:MAG: hypothetical protein E7562_02005 [Ruminococcaceae bacterium]|nr:hypothetical protein [Oscillospiraceae bacterium]
MKKVTAIFLCLVMCIYLCGCGDTEKKDNEAKTALTQVLNKEKNFTVHNVYVDKTTEENLEKFRYPTYSNALNIFVPAKYTFADFDADGIEELLIIDAYLSDFLFLKYDNGKVYGYVHKRISTQDVKTDGSFMTFKYNGYKAISRISFSGNSYKITNQAYFDDSQNKYLIGDKTVQKNEVEEYFENWNKNTTKVAWKDIN